MRGTASLAVRDDRATRPDARSWSDRRAGRKRYGKAHKYYGKTYIVTKKQLWWGVAVWIGTALASGSAMFMGYLWLHAQVC